MAIFTVIAADDSGTALDLPTRAQASTTTPNLIRVQAVTRGGPGTFQLVEAKATMTDFDVEVFYDGACPLCMREIRMLRRRDHGGRIRFTDIAAEGFDAGSVGLTWAALMDRIHGRLPDGTLIEGVEVFRRLYAAVGFSKLVTLTRAPGISQLLDLAYRLFAKNRLALTGRCDNGACELHQAHRPPASTRAAPADPRA